MLSFRRECPTTCRRDCASCAPRPPAPSTGVMGAPNPPLHLPGTVVHCIGLAKKFVRAPPCRLLENRNELFGQPQYHHSGGCSFLPPLYLSSRCLPFLICRMG